ncbi:MAG: CPBP family intramembrane glutamic endopeptidase [Polyangiales bacterium]
MGRAPWWVPGVVYAALAALGATLAQLHHGGILTPPPGPRFADDPATAQTVGLALALALSLLTLVATRWLVAARVRWADALARALRGAVLGASPRELRWMALGGALAEELLFRAALVPILGIAASAVVFGALHFSGRATYFTWMLWATGMGVLLGMLFVYSGSLLPPLLAHALINHENMRFLRAGMTPPEGPLAARPHDPRTRRL